MLRVRFPCGGYFLNYVYVNSAFRGQSVGQDIVKAAIAAAEQRNLKPMPICGYAKTIMQRNRL